MKKEQFELIKQYMLKNVDKAAHDELHIYRVLNNALLIAKKYKNLNKDVLITSCLLHDIARPLEFNDRNIDHSIEGGKMAYHFLIENGYDEIFSEHVKQCIITHRFRSNNPPKSIEAKILFDADKLDVIGPIGIARTLIYNGQFNEPLYYLDSDGKIDYNANFEAKDSFLKEYNYKLVKMNKILYTKEAKRLSKRKKNISDIFYKELIRQIETKEIDKIHFEK